MLESSGFHPRGNALQASLNCPKKSSILQSPAKVKDILSFANLHVKKTKGKILSFGYLAIITRDEDQDQHYISC